MTNADQNQMRARGSATHAPASTARTTKAFKTIHNYTGDAGRGSQTFAGSETWRRALLGTVAAGALFFGYARRAYAQHIPPDATCPATNATTITCTGDVSTGVSLVNGNGPYTTLNVNNLTTSITPADGVYGIEFTSSAAGDIAINSNTGTFGISTTNAYGIYAYTQGGQVTIDSTGDIAANGGGGISVLRNGGTTDVSITSVGNITSTFAGISVNSGQSTGAITIDSTGDITAGTAIDAANDGYGNVSVTSNGTLLASITGISARAAYDDVTVNNTGNITADNLYGIYARSGSTGTVSVTNHGNVAAYSDAIFARSDTGAVTVNSTGDLTSATGRGIYAANAGAGAVTVTNNGNITSSSTGIRAASIGGAGTVTVNSTGDITVSGANVSAILASTDGASAASVTSIGNLSATRYGIFVVSQGGVVTVDSTGNVTSGVDAVRVDATTATGNVTLGAGKVYGARDGVNLYSGAANTLTNFASLSGGTRAVSGGAGNDKVYNYGIITGNVDLGGGANTFNNMPVGTFNSGTAVNLGAGNTLTNAGNLSPGGIGTVQTTALTGNIVQTGTGTFTVDMAGASADRIDATGSADLAGTVVVNIAAVPTASQFTILSAAGGTTDNGLGLSASPALNAFLTYPNANDVVLNVSVNFFIDGLNRNERALAGYLNGAWIAGTGGLSPVMTGLLNAGDFAAYRAALDQLLPEIYSDEQIASLFAHLAFAGNLLSCKVNGNDTASIIHEGQCLWAGANAGFLDTGSTFQLLGFNESAGRFAAGAQVAIDPVWRLGFGAGYQSSTLETATNASAEGQAGQGGVALKYNPGPFLLAGLVSGGRSWYDTKRPMAFGNFAATALGDARIDTLNGSVRLAYVFGSPELYAKPVMDAAVTRIDLHGLTETGGGAANLAVSSETPTVYTIAPSLEIGTEWWWSNGTLVRPYLRGGATWFTNTYFGLHSTFVSAPAGVTPFLTMTGMDDVMGTVGAGLDMITNDDTVLHLTYDGQFGHTTQINTIALKGSARF